MINQEAAQFEKVNHDTQSVNAVFINWIGFSLDPYRHKFLHGLELDPRIHPADFQLT